MTLEENSLAFSTLGTTPKRWMLFLHGILGSGINWKSFARSFVDRCPSWGAALIDPAVAGHAERVAQRVEQRPEVGVDAIVIEVAPLGVEEVGRQRRGRGGGHAQLGGRAPTLDPGRRRAPQDDRLAAARLDPDGGRGGAVGQHRRRRGGAGAGAAGREGDRDEPGELGRSHRRAPSIAPPALRARPVAHDRRPWRGR